MTRRVYGFDELAAAEAACGGSWDRVRGLLGGKGANLADMTRIGVPVPPGFTVTTEACNAYLAAGESFPPGLWEEERAALDRLEQQTGKNFGDAANPLLVSCRSGAKFSMPGMMDTVLNIGLNDAVAEGMAKLTGDSRFVYDSYRRLVQMFGSVVMGVADEPFEEVLTAARANAGVATDSELGAEEWKRVTGDFQRIVRRQAGRDFPQDPIEQIRLATEAVFRSWNGKRAHDYRNAAKIAHDLGTAVNICTMVFGNLGNDSATGVAMTRSGATGENAIEGRLPHQRAGRGRRRRHPADQADRAAEERDARGLRRVRGDLPQARAALPGDAGRRVHHRARQALDAADARRQAHRPGRRADRRRHGGGRADHPPAGGAARLAGPGRLLPPPAVRQATPSRAPSSAATASPPASTSRRVRRSARSRSTPTPPSAGRKRRSAPVIMVRPETKPDDVHGMLAASGILTSRGGRTCHAALVARQFGKPAVVGVAALDIDLEARTIRGRRTHAARRGLGVDRRHAGARLRRRARHRGARHPRPRSLEAARLGRRVPPPAGVGQRRLPGRRPPRPRVRRAGHRPLPHRAHVLRDRTGCRTCSA